MNGRKSIFVRIFKLTKIFILNFEFCHFYEDDLILETFVQSRFTGKKIKSHEKRLLLKATIIINSLY